MIQGEEEEENKPGGEGGVEYCRYGVLDQ